MDTGGAWFELVQQLLTRCRPELIVRRYYDRRDTTKQFQYVAPPLHPAHPGSHCFSHPKVEFTSRQGRAVLVRPLDRYRTMPGDCYVELQDCYRRDGKLAGSQILGWLDLADPDSAAAAAHLVSGAI